MSARQRPGATVSVQSWSNLDDRFADCRVRRAFGCHSAVRCNAGACRHAVHRWRNRAGHRRLPAPWIDRREQGRRAAGRVDARHAGWARHVDATDRAATSSRHRCRSLRSSHRPGRGRRARARSFSTPATSRPWRLAPISAPRRRCRSASGHRRPKPRGPTEKSKEPAPKDVHERKAFSDAAAYIRSLAQLRGRNAEWGEKAVLDAASLSANEALEQKVVDLIAADVPALLQQARRPQDRRGRHRARAAHGRRASRRLDPGLARPHTVGDSPIPASR